ncbi:DHH family phosphoesterase [uncultured Dubosiella sp.]|uniref:single-stranded-DNA-specific exonuclease RecJ n=3 Tax=uncultured Dubosiella sp. TaxID=1937011 RepID=UPI0025F5962C|nr:DHH family phosphoesterase [uncultured Dubosiella sp.]
MVPVKQIERSEEGRALVRRKPDGAPCAVKAACTVRSGGKGGEGSKPYLSLYGIMATSIMVGGLQAYGIETGFYIPDRIKEGYGLQPHTVQLAYEKGYRTIVTVDNGVKAKEALELAQTLGMTTIVTDHHVIEEDVNCDILVHPSLLEDEFSGLCGAGVAYECMRVLGVASDYHLMMAAVASIGDVMPVTKQTRCIIQHGIRLLNEKKEIHLSGFIKDQHVTETTIAFQVVPKINSIGRLSNMANANNVVRYMLSEDRDEIIKLAGQIEQINERRKVISAQMSDQALRMLDRRKAVHLIMSPGFHEGIIGLVAGKICNETNRPTIVAAKNVNGYKMSMRAPKGFDCLEFLKDFPSFSAIGGHTQVAGFSIDLADYASFERYVETRANTYEWREAEPDHEMLIDESDINVAAIESLDILRPFGPGFEMPVMILENPSIKNLYDFQNARHRRYTLSSGACCMRFNQPGDEIQKSVNRIRSFEGELQVSEYRGRKQANFMIEKITYQ